LHKAFLCEAFENIFKFYTDFQKNPTKMQTWFKHAVCDAALRVSANFRKAEVFVSGKDVLVVADLRGSRSHRVIMHAKIGERFTIAETQRRHVRKVLMETFPGRVWKEDEKLTELMHRFHKHHTKDSKNESYCIPPKREPSWWSNFAKDFDDALGIYPQGHNSHIFEE
jgi:hypothetical protein